MNDYSRDYQTLGVSDDCSLDTLKAARRRLVGSWHPDRFPEGGESRRLAEERIKNINIAFERLLEHYRTHGRLPSPSSVLSTQIRSANSDSSENFSNTEPAEFTADTPVVNREATLRRKNRSVGLRALVLLAIAVIGTEGIRILTDQNKLLETSETSRRVALQSPIRQPTAHPNTSRSHSSSPTPFTVGSTLGDVYAIQGPPTSTDKDIWYYGKSSVYFIDGVVTSWVEDPDNPLHSSLTSSHPVPTAETYTIGSTKLEVRAVEGAPLVETTTLWDYGLSKVYFRDGRVSGWDSSPMRPLKARRQ